MGGLAELPGPVAVAYEAGPTGFGLARELTAAGVRCVVAAPSKLQRPPGDRVKTDARDARHLARLLRMDQIVAVRVPSVEQEAARDLVRAREDVRGDLMRARHRLSKLLLRQGIVYSGGHAVDRRPRGWLRGQQFAAPGLQLAFDAAFETVLLTTARRDRLDKAIAEMAADSEFTPVVRRLCCLRGVSTLTGFGLAVEIGDWHRFTGSTHRRLPGVGAHRVLLRRSPDPRGRSPRPGTPTPAGCWSRRPGTTARPTAPGMTMRARWDQAPPAARARGHAGQPPAASPLGAASPTGRSGRSSPTSRSPGNWPAGAGRWP